MKRAIVFARRNIKETLRSPVSWGFGLALPVAIFSIMQIIVKSIGDAAAQVPMFGVERFTGGVAIFAGSFLSMLTAMTISSDRAKSFLSRLIASPMTSAEFIVGYVLGILPFAAVQNLVVFATAMCFGLITVRIVPALLFAMLFSLLFVAIGVTLGSALPEKSAPPLCSAVVQVAALLSGMWFDLDAIGGGFEVFCKVLPFAHCYDAIRYTLGGEWDKLWLPIVVVAAYAVALCVTAVLVFKSSSKRG